MFLTRLGFGSCSHHPGDVTQVDFYPVGNNLALAQALRVI